MKKNGWARARAGRGREKERLDPGPGQARAIEKERTHWWGRLVLPEIFGQTARFERNR